MKYTELKSIVNEVVSEISNEMPSDIDPMMPWSDPSDTSQKPGTGLGSDLDAEKLNTKSDPFYLLRFTQDRLMSVTKKHYDSDVPQRFEDAIAYLLSPEETSTLKVKHSDGRLITLISYIDTGYDRIQRNKIFIVQQSALKKFFEEYPAEGRHIMHRIDKIIGEPDTTGIRHLPQK
jgi:hypothetical protein